MSNLNKQIKTATKWSAIAEIAAKLITPITSMVLARLLTPEAFGVVTTLTMIITFAEIFTDAGFQKYLIQHEFVDETDRVQSTNVAFWSNLVMSLLIWLVIGIFSEPLATMVGNPGLGHVLTIACVSIPLAAFSSIQMALYKRDMDFRTLFKARFIGICIPLVVTIPLALWLKSYWALVWGTIATNVVNAILLTCFSKWKPSFYYSFQKLKEMFSFTFWSMIETLSIWITSYIDVFIIGSYLNEYYLGLYKTSITVVGQICGLVTATITPVLFSTLSRLQNNDKEFKQMFFRFQRIFAVVLLPINIGIYIYRELITSILLGAQWMIVADFIGLWALIDGINIVLSHQCSTVYRAKGHPRLSVLSQCLYCLVLFPVVLIAVKYDFETLYISRAMVKFVGILVNSIILYFLVKISIFQMIQNISASLLCSVIMGGMAYVLLQIDDNMMWQFISILVCILIYFVIIMQFKKEKEMVYPYIVSSFNKIKTLI